MGLKEAGPDLVLVVLIWGSCGSDFRFNVFLPRVWPAARDWEIDASVWR